MIDEEKLKKAANNYVGSEPSRDEGSQLSAERASFMDGAQWAQEEFIKSLWHDKSEEPQGYNKWVIIKYDSHPYTATHQVKKNEHWENLTKGCPSFHWLYLDDILPKEGGEK